MKLSFFKTSILLAAILSLVGCAGAVPWNKQNYAGINDVSFDWCKVDVSDGGEQFLPCNVSIVNGKEYGAIEFKFEMPDGTLLNFAADDVRAFEGQALRAEVERVLTEQFGEVAPGVVDAVISALTGIN